MAEKWVESPYPGTKVKQPNYAPQNGGYVGVGPTYQTGNSVARTPIQNAGDTVAAKQTADETSGAAGNWRKGGNQDPNSPTS